MTDDMKEMIDQAPSLTLTPFEEEKDTQPIEIEKKAAEPEVILSPSEQKMVDEFAAKIDLGNSNIILQYGAGAQKKIADFSQNALNNVKTKDLGEIGEMLSGVVSELKSFEAAEEEKGLFGLFKKNTNKLANMRLKYEKAESNINRICKTLEEHQIQLLKDSAMLDKMYELNLTYFKELSMYILAGKQKLGETRTKEIPALLEHAKRTGLPEDTQRARDLAGLCNRFEKKIYDLELTRTVSLQMAPQIRLIQENDTVMSEKIQSTLVNTIPLWKSQMVLAIGVSHSEKAAKAQREVSDMTNELLKKNAETLKTATIETAKEAERGIVDIETLKTTNQALISTLDEVLKIQSEGRRKRQEAELELSRIEDDLKKKLLSMAT